MSHRPTDQGDSRPARGKAPPESPSFTISDSDPLVTVTPERSFTGMKPSSAHDTTPLAPHQPAQCTRRTPGAEILQARAMGEESARPRDIDAPFRLLQALENLKLSTSEGSASDASFLAESESGGSPPSDLYSLWGRPMASSSTALEPTGRGSLPSGLHFPFAMPSFASAGVESHGTGESALRGERHGPFGVASSSTGAGFVSSKGPVATPSSPAGHRRYPSTDMPSAPGSNGSGGAFAPSFHPSVAQAAPPRGYHSRVNSVGGPVASSPSPSPSPYPFQPVYPFAGAAHGTHATGYPPPHGASGGNTGPGSGEGRAMNVQASSTRFVPSLPVPNTLPPAGYPPTPAYTTTRYGPSSPTPTDSAPTSARLAHPPPRPLDTPTPTQVPPTPTTSEAGSQADSPTSNMKFKQFFRSFKQKEKAGYEEASLFAREHLEILPDKIHWKVYLELADLAKRENRIQQARGFYQRVNQLQPTAAQGWLEYAKMEEECGNLEACKQILSEGLTHCTVNESLMVKCLKHYERMNHLTEARALLGALKDVPVDRTWRTIMEGGLLEARQGNILVARQVFHYLVNSVPWYGPIYQEACRFEEKCEEHANAMRFVELGLAENPRYGPLWFSALRLTEKLSENGDVSAMHATVERAIKSISKELVWKLHFEAAQIEERAGNIQEAREFYVKSVAFCPDNLLWKVWMGGARTELNYENIDTARKLLQRALDEVPPKMKAMVLLECCRLEEYAHQMDKAREILAKAKKYTKHEWKVFLESVLLEMRANHLDRAIQEAEEALLIHTGTGRLWAVMIQLKQAQGLEEQMQVFRQALSEVPKSGEVWCEGARIALQQEDFVAARKYINFAIQFTPQYGDSFIEYLRLEMLEKGPRADLAGVEQACVNADPNYGALWLHCKQNPLDSTRHVIRRAKDLLVGGEELSSPPPPLSSASGAGAGVEGEGGVHPAARSLMVNDIYRNVHQRSNEERRKAIFL